MLRDPAVTIPERTLRLVLAFVTDRTSPAYGEYPNQAGFSAHSLVAEVRACSAGQGRSPLAGERAVRERGWDGRARAVPDASG